VRKLEREHNRTALHPIHLALKIRADLDSGKVNSYSEAGKLYGLSRARICQLLNLLKLHESIKDFLFELRDPDMIRRFGEHTFRNYKDNVSDLRARILVEKRT